MSEKDQNVKPSILETTKRLQAWIKDEIDRANDQLKKIKEDIEKLEAEKNDMVAVIRYLESWLARVDDDLSKLVEEELSKK